MFTFEYVDFSTTSQAVRSYLANKDFHNLATLLRELDVIQVIEQCAALNSADAAVLYRLLDKERSLEVFEKIDAPVQAELLLALQDESVAERFAALDTADRVALLDELPAKVAAELLRGLEGPARAATSLLLGYQPKSTGRLMSSQFLSVHDELTVKQGLELLTPRLSNTKHNHVIMVLGQGRKFLGALGLSDLLSHEHHMLIREIYRGIPSAVASDLDTDTARLAVEHHLELLPVLDDEARLIGVLPLADAIKVLDRQEETRTAHGAGTEPLHRPYLGTPLRTLVRARVVWLLVLAVGATLTVQVLSTFEQTLESMVVLSLFIPLIVGIGGNTGNQAATTVTRALAMGEVKVRDLGRVVLREVRIGAMLGLSLGTIAFLIASFVFELKVGLIIGLTLIVLCSVAAAVGGAMPIIGKFFKADPAVFSNPFISTFVDAAGLVVYLSVAVIVLGH